MGLQSVQDVVNQNNGEIQFEATENTFIVRVILFNYRKGGIVHLLCARKRNGNIGSGQES